MRTTSGDWRVSRDFANLPAWIVKAVGGSTVHWAGASLRFQDHEWRIRSEYGDGPGANLLDWPVALNRKNALFAGSNEGAANWGIIASLIETAKLNGADPQAYVASTLTALVNAHPAKRIEELMPWATSKSAPVSRVA
jgi:choline dehydrogenase-like flavoprotein